MKQIYYIIGEAHVGKSTLVRTLTGLRQRAATTIRTADGADLRFWAWMTSMQELGITPDALVEEMLGEDDVEYDWYIIPLRIRAANGFPPGQEYIDELGQHFGIAGIVIFGEDTAGLNLPDNAPAPVLINPKSTPRNEIAQRVRSAWRWM